jgi:hypothetical protein
MIKNSLIELGLAMDSPLAVPGATNYRPPCWPPKRDWPVIIDAKGHVVSRWGDPIWRLDPWAGKSITLNFGDGPVKKHAAAISPANADLLRLVTGWWIYGPNGARGYRGLKSRFDQMRRLFVLCTQEGIPASELSHYPRVSDRLVEVLQVSRAGEFLALLHELFERRDALGFTLLNREGLARLAASVPDHHTRQTAYIPPRIWRYQVTRLRECLDDFLAHQFQVEELFRFCVDAYRQNATNSRGHRDYGPVIDTAKRLGITSLLERWMGLSQSEISVHALTRYLGIVSRAGLGYLLNFSLMRVEEAWNLRSDCLRVERDPHFGDIYVLRGSTTKTMSDPGALWVTSPSVEVAIQAMRAISKLRAECDLLTGERSNMTPFEGYLTDYALEPWVTKVAKVNRALRPSIPSYATALQQFGKLFDPEQLRISQEDFALARLVTPTLSEEFAVGKIWPLAWHQLRRTGAVNMQASGLVSDASLQFQLKHVARAMSLYYGQNHSRVRLEENAHTLYVRTMYETLGRQLQQLTSDRFVSPHGEKRKSEIVRLISADEAKKVINLAKKGTVSHRPVLLGVCTSRTPCPYGGIDNIAHCGGGDSSEYPKPCAHVLYDPEQLNEVEALEAVLERRLATAEVDSPLRASLEAQKRSVENYRNVIRQTKLC